MRDSGVIRGRYRARVCLLAALSALLLLSAGGLLASGAGVQSGAGEATPSVWDTVAVFGPQRFAATRGQAQRHVERFTVEALPDARFLLRVAGGRSAARARVWVDGDEVVTDMDLRRGADPMERTLFLASGEHVLEVEVQGGGEAALTVSVLREPDPTFAVIGRRRFVRSTGAPVVEHERFVLPPSAGPPYTLEVRNGAADGSQRVSSATVALNGEPLLGPDDLNQRVRALRREVALAEGGLENVLDVEVRSGPGSFLELWGRARDVLPPVLGVTAPPAGQVTNRLEVEAAGTIEDVTPVRVWVNDSTASVVDGRAFRATVPLLAEGENPIRYTAIDAAGNRTDSLRVVIRDTEPPVVLWSDPADGLVTREGVLAVRGSVEDRTRVEMNVNGLPLAVDEAGAFGGEVTLPADGVHYLTVAAVDQATNATSLTRRVTRDTEPPVITVSAPEDGSSTTEESVVLRGAVQDLTEVALTLNAAPVALSGGEFSAEVPLEPGANALTLAATDQAGNSASLMLTITREADSPLGPDVPAGPIPPDPATVAPALDRTVATTLHAATEFLYAGEDPIQTGVEPDSIDPVRTAVIRGRVLRRDRTPLAGVRVTVKDHPELGQTITRDDGGYDLVVNGGLLTLDFQRSGYFPAQRQVDAPWQDYARVEDVILLQPDTLVTSVRFGADTVQVVRGSVQEDADGSRAATLLVPSGAEAVLRLPDGSVQPAGTLSLRLTEYTVGDEGPQAMPALLPPTSRYTYAVQVSADGVPAGAVVEFSEPVPLYVENFLGFPVGTPVPVGSFDADRAVWVPEDNGRIIQIVGTADGVAEVDVDGDGLADAPAELQPLGITPEEQARLAVTFSPGQSIWRAEVLRSWPYDLNWGGEVLGRDPLGVVAGECADQLGGFNACVAQSAAQRVAVAGTPYTLNYSSDRSAGAANRALEIELVGDSVPQDLQRVELEVEVAGRTWTESFEPRPNLTHTFRWDGRDAYGREVQGTQPVTARIGHVYPMAYQVPADGARSFGLNCTEPIPVNGTVTCSFPRDVAIGSRRSQGTRWQTVRSTLGGWDARNEGTGGFTLDQHHRYDPVGKVLYLGDGRRRSGRYNGPDPRPLPMTTVRAIAVGPDGSIYGTYDWGNQIARLDRNGQVTIIAGNGESCPEPDFYSWYWPRCGEGGPAVDAPLDYISDLSVGPDGTVYFTQYASVRKVTPDGVLLTVAGMDAGGFGGDGGPALQARFKDPQDVTVAPDGSLYIADTGNRRIRKISPDGTITTVAGGAPFRPVRVDGWLLPNQGFEGPATQAYLHTPTDVALGSDGTLYIASEHQVLRVDPDGILHRVAGALKPLWTCIYGFGYGTADYPACGDGGPALDAILAVSHKRSSWPGDLEVARDGTIYVQSDARLRRITPDGVINAVGGSSRTGYSLAIGPDGSVLSVRHGQVHRISGVLPGIGEMRSNSSTGETQLEIMSEDGRRVYVFDSRGRHLRTLNAVTGEVELSFGYDAQGLLTTVTDGDGLVTRIERDGTGNAVALVAPRGQRTGLALSDDGDLRQVVGPDGRPVTMEYEDGGLLTAVTDPRGNRRSYDYDASGRLIGRTDAAGNHTQIARTGTYAEPGVALTSALGRTVGFSTQRLPTGSVRQAAALPGGQQVVTTTNPDGSTETLAPDGTVTRTLERPDPRFGMQSPLVETTVTTPAGLQFVEKTERSVQLADPANPQSLLRQTERRTINGRTSTQVYDRAASTITTTSAAGRRSVTRLDAQSRPVEQSVPGFATAYTYYDAEGRPREIRQGDRTRSQTYDALGRLETRTDALGRTESYRYDEAGRLKEHTLADGRVVGYGYDANGNLESLTPPGRTAHRFFYGATNAVDSVAPPPLDGVGSVTRHYYNDVRQLERTVQPGGRTIVFAYDSIGRHETVTLDEGAISYDYDEETGQLEGVAAPGGVALSYAYDGRLLTNVEWTGPVSAALGLVYDDDFRVKQQTVNGAHAVSFDYDADGLLAGAGELVIARDPANGLPTGSTLRGVATAVTYNGFGERKSIRASHGTTELFRTSYVRDDGGRIETLSETIGGDSTTWGYRYDRAGRLETVTRDGQAYASFEYDANGNRTRTVTPNGVLSGRPDAQDRLVQYGDASYLYTDAGDLEAKVVDGDTTRYHYDALGNLRDVVLPGGTRIDYVIDGENRRVGKKVDGQLTQGWLYDGGLRIVAELDGSGQVISRFVYGDRVNVPEYMVSGSRTYRLVHDHLGSIRLVVDVETGEVVQRVDYGPWGEVLDDSNPGFQPFGYAGGLRDSHTGLVRFGARDYDPQTGRWTAKDPVGFEGGDPNLYGYALQDPVNGLDPHGETLISETYAAGVRATLQTVWRTHGQLITNMMVSGSYGCMNSMVAGSFTSRRGESSPGGDCLEGAFWGAVTGGMAYKLAGAMGGSTALRRMVAEASAGCAGATATFVLNGDLADGEIPYRKIMVGAKAMFGACAGGAAGAYVNEKFIHNPFGAAIIGAMAARNGELAMILGDAMFGQRYDDW